MEDTNTRQSVCIGRQNWYKRFFFLRPDFKGKTANYSLKLVQVAFPSLERAFEVNFLLEQGKQEKKKGNKLAESISRA